MSELTISTSTSKSIADFLDSFQIRNFNYQPETEDENTAAKSLIDEIIAETESSPTKEELALS